MTDTTTTSDLEGMILGDDKSSATKSELTTTGDNASTSVDTTKKIRFIDQIDEDTSRKLIELAPQALTEFEKDENKLSTFGSDVVKSVNMIVDKELDRPDKKNLNDSKELNALIRSMTGEFQETITDYQPNAFLDDVDKKANALVRWFNGKRNRLKKWRFDSQSILQRFKYVETKLTEKNAVLDTNISWGYSMMEENRNASVNLVKIISMLEAIRDEATREVESLTERQKSLEQTDLEWQNIQDRISTLSVIIHEIDIKHTEYVVALFDAYGTNNQILTIITISQGIRNKTDHIINSTIKDMKKAILQIDALMQAKSAADLDENVINASEAARALQRQTAENSVGYIASVMEAPSTSAESILAMAKSVIKQNEDYINAINEGAKKRAEVENAAVDGMKMISDSASDTSRKVVQAMLNDTGMAQQKPSIEKSVLDDTK